MGQAPRVIEEQMSETRNHLVEHLNALEDRFGRKVAQPAHQAAETIESVKNSLSDVSNFAQAVRDQFNRQPWLTVGLSLVAGFGLERLIARGMRTRHNHGQIQIVPQPAPPPLAPAPEAVQRAKTETNGHNGRSHGDDLRSHVSHAAGDLIDELQVLAVEAAKSFAWGMLAKAAPEVFDPKHAEDVAPHLKSGNKPAGTVG